MVFIEGQGSNIHTIIHIKGQQNSGGDCIIDRNELNSDLSEGEEITKENKLEEATFSGSDLRKMNRNLRLAVILQLAIIIFLLLNFMLLQMGFFSRDAVIDAGEGIDMSIESVGESYIDYSVGLSLKNTGDELARISVTGEVYISEMGSATGDEMTKVLNYKYLEIPPGQTKDLAMGTITTFKDWHYVVKVHVNWNGGSLELSKMLVPNP